MTAGTAQRIFDDLLTLEVNVILKDGMTGRKMPDPRLALLDVVGYYDDFLAELAAEHDVADDRVGDEPVTAKTFATIRERACHLEESLRRDVGAKPASGVGVIVKRIYRNCDQVERILDRPQVRQALGAGIKESQVDLRTPLPLTADEALTVRKVWEVGTEQIVMQTVVQLDGDIVTRIQRDRNSAATAAMHALHREGVDNALQHWQFMFRTVAELTSKALRDFLAR
jgi:hypothetical protein